MRRCDISEWSAGGRVTPCETKVQLCAVKVLYGWGQGHFITRYNILKHICDLLI